MLTFTDCVARMSQKNGHKLDHNTTLRVVDNNTFAVRLYQTDVVLIHADGTYTLNNGGFKTVTTKDRINKFSPARVYQSKKKWHLGDGTEYTNGVRIGQDGRAVQPAALAA